MAAEYTHKIRSLSDQEFHDIKSEIDRTDHSFWIKHFKHDNPLLALRDGESIHLNWPTKNPQNAMPERLEFFPHTESIIRTVIDDGHLGRAYIHRLKPGDGIPKHNDAIHIRPMKIINRYQIYLDIPENSIIWLDQKLVQNKNQFRGSIVDFALQNNHAYKNLSTENWYFIVFDRTEL